MSYDEDLLEAADHLLLREPGQRGKLPAARIRRSISTSYYALFHFILDEVVLRVVGVTNDLRKRRRILARTISHKVAKSALEKFHGGQVGSPFDDFFGPTWATAGRFVPPVFVQNLAKAFVDAQTKRHDADYNLNEVLSESDARLLRTRVAGVIAGWRAADTAEDRDFKHALSLLILVKAQLRAES